MPRRTAADLEGRMTLTEHLVELRRRIFVAAIAILAGTITAFVFHGHILNLLTGPYCGLPAKYHVVSGAGSHCALVVTGITDGFTLTLKLSIYTGIIGSAPIWLWQLWGFITPGLYKHERRWAVSFVAISLGLFALGGFFAWLTLHKGLRFLRGFADGHGLAPLLSFNSYLSFVIAMILIFGVSFEFPLLVSMLNLANVLTYQRLKHWTRAIIFGIFVFAGVATPSQDPFTMLALAVPMTLLFGVSMIIAFFHDRRADKASPYADLDDDEASPLFDDEPSATLT
jgi:sec-independent protein translocase protein TatC